MQKKLIYLTIAIFIFTNSLTAQTWKYRASVNLNGFRSRTLELAGQAHKNEKVLYNLNIGFTYQTPRGGFVPLKERTADSLGITLKTSGFFIKPGIQINLFQMLDKFSKAEVFIGTGVTGTFYNRNTEIVFKSPLPKANKTFTGSNFAPYVSLGTSLRATYNIYLDLGLQYTITKSQSNDNLLPQKYDWLPGQGGNYRGGNKIGIILTAHYQFE